MDLPAWNYADYLESAAPARGPALRTWKRFMVTTFTYRRTSRMRPYGAFNALPPKPVYSQSYSATTEVRLNSTGGRLGLSIYF